ncbi:hypothetical protein TPHA_0K00790 [Tetrapisispora phaffii CBS 4417]|uniref:Glutamyl-tRNA(Gln) amidotransferase subunit B, mitochondrial n=1 Tax=Tetrapisispora phaffii (strain ATCC 24235 / CBS 4417 / NBRC 1672 / NRRL Y-8282 / UCD 70-5) TaxID=1071381 RepID=G8BZ85_TETPH|nr:hypothetical protein TPHA_0K00790 [Tetrapisispora phaffii CBS 4417]CCE65213.1 hypothetical protein TPHA_0K00790 [Tetrapisispora phaffii CBS 4417]
MEMLVNCRRYLSVGSVKKFSLVSGYNLKCGLEVHTQLDTKHKLFSFSTNDPFGSVDKPNQNISYFDAALPGSQPILNYEVVLQALKLASVLGCSINYNSQFDRKHYFYGDQPLGYQITQHYSPIASNGHLRLSPKFDGIGGTKDKTIDIIQLQIEQDTGKSIYIENEDLTLLDFNRSNVPLIEMVTKPDFTTIEQVRAFVKKYQNLIKILGVSTGELETGAMRVDVNISINDLPRVELKNLPNTSSIVNAIKYEYNRQIEIIHNGKAEEELSFSETRGWNGSETVKLRSKETTIDYRYMPDSELPKLKLAEDIMKKVKESLPPLPDELFEQLTHHPYNLSLKDAKIFVISNTHTINYENAELRQYYLEVFKRYSDEIGAKNINPKLPNGWIINELIGDLNKLDLYLNDITPSLTPKVFAQLLSLIHTKKISKTSGKLLLFHVLKELKDRGSSSVPININFDTLIEEFELEQDTIRNKNDLVLLCQHIIDELDNKKMIADIISGKKKNGLKFLVGQGMRSSQGKLDPIELEKTFKSMLEIKW